MDKINSNFENKYDSFKSNSSYFESMNLDEDIKVLYESLGYKNKNEELNRLRNQNHSIYVSIINKPISKLPSEFNILTNSIINIIEQIDIAELLIEDNEKAIEHNKMLTSVQKDVEKLESMLKIALKNLVKTNDSNQSKLEMSRVTCAEKNIILDAYKEAILEYANVDLENIYNEFFNQLNRRDKLRNVYKLILKYDEEYISSGVQKQIDEINSKLRKIVNKYKEKIIYLNDLIMENSKYQNKLIALTYYINEKLDYNEYNLLDIKELYKELSVHNELDEKISKLENLFVTERENVLKEEQFIKEKIGKRNINTTIKYIKSKYLNRLSIEEGKIINEINDDTFKSSEKLSPIVNNIWKNEITSVYEYSLDNSYKFLVTNDIFKDEVIEAILISDKIISKVNDYSNYELGFICSYNDNILNITENDELLDNIYDDLSKLKTPLQLEEEFISFKVCNRIALNGYKTDIIGVYYIADGDDLKYLTAVSLANTYNLPLIQIIK